MLIFLPGFSTWLTLDKRPECKWHNWPAIAIAIDRLWEHAVAEQMMPWEFGADIDIDNQIEIEAGSKTFVVRKNKTKHKRSEQ